jgi:phosphatidylserine decarboxylase
MLTYLLIGVALAAATVLLLAWKWELGLARAALFAVTAGALACLAVVGLGSLLDLSGIVVAVLVWVLTMACAFSVLAYRFYRDPERTPPTAEGLIMSPADGEVVYVRHARRGVLPAVSKGGREHALEELTRTPLRHEDAVVVGIGMTFLDVHVNRAPIAGTIALRRHFAGSFGSLKRPEMAFRNERLTTVIERGGLQVAVVQIASRLVRQIVSFVDEGRQVALGQRIGVIRFGSQVDVVLPARRDLEVRVEPGMHVRAGESTIAVMRGHRAHPSQARQGLVLNRSPGP